jgi:hypothetical protein
MPTYFVIDGLQEHRKSGEVATRVAVPGYRTVVERAEQVRVAGFD